MHISGFFICFSLIPFPPPPCCQASPKPTVTGPSGPLRDLSGTGGGWMELHQHPTLDHRRRQMRAPRPEVLPSSLYALRPVLSGTSQAQMLLQVPGCSPMAKTRFHIWDPGLGSQDPDHHCDTPALQGYPGRPRDSLSLSPTPYFPEAFAQV